MTQLTPVTTLSCLDHVRRSSTNNQKRPPVPRIRWQLRNSRQYASLIKEAAAFTCPFRITFQEDTGYHHNGLPSGHICSINCKNKCSKANIYTQDTSVKVITKGGLVFLAIFDGHGAHFYSHTAKKVATRIVMSDLDRVWSQAYHGYNAFCQVPEIEKQKANAIKTLTSKIQKCTYLEVPNRYGGTTVQMLVIDPLARAIYDFNLGDSSLMLFEHHLPVYDTHIAPIEASYLTENGLYTQWNTEQIGNMLVYSTQDHSADIEREKIRVKKLGIPIMQDIRGIYRLDGLLMTTGGYGDHNCRGMRRSDEADIYRKTVRPGTVAVQCSDGLFEGLHTVFKKTGKIGFLRNDHQNIVSMAKFIYQNHNHPKLAYGLTINQLTDIESIAGYYCRDDPNRPWINEWDNHATWTVQFL